MTLFWFFLTFLYDTLFFLLLYFVIVNRRHYTHTHTQQCLFHIDNITALLLLHILYIIAIWRFMWMWRRKFRSCIIYILREIETVCAAPSKVVHFSPFVIVFTIGFSTLHHSLVSLAAQLCVLNFDLLNFHNSYWFFWLKMIIFSIFPRSLSFFFHRVLVCQRESVQWQQFGWWVDWTTTIWCTSCQRKWNSGFLGGIFIVGKLSFWKFEIKVLWDWNKGKTIHYARNFYSKSLMANFTGTLYVKSRKTNF